MDTFLTSQELQDRLSVDRSTANRMGDLVSHLLSARDRLVAPFDAVAVPARAAFAFARDDWQVRTESLLAVTCDATQFYLDGRITGYEGTEVVSERTWKERIPRVAY